MQRIKAFLQSKWTRVLTAVVLIVIPFASAQAVFGDLVAFGKDTILYIISWLLYYLLVGVMGFFATLATNLLVYVAQLNNFTDLPVIIEIWQVSRDLTNMGFIVMLLVIAFGTLFRLEAYSWKKLLPKMIIAAILVNYSRAICGFLVDASQVVMLTFVAAIKDAAAVGLTSAFQLDKLLQFGQTNSALNPGEVGAVTSSQQRLVAIIAAGFMLSTMFTVQCVYIVVLVGRLVMIWFLTALSPFRAGAMVLPQTERYASQFDETFIRYLVVGIMAVGSLWFSMYVAAKAIDSGGLGSIAASEAVKKAQLEDSKDNVLATSGALDTTLISGFIIATMMLMLGMKLTQENASELGSSMGKVGAFFTGVGVAKLASYPAGYLNDVQFARTGVDLNASRIKDRWAHGLAANKKARVTEGESVAAQKYREGFLLAGTTGAGDQVAELGLRREQLRGGIVGNIPLLRNWDRGRRAPWVLGGRQGKFENALNEENKLQAESASIEEDMKRIRKNKDYTTVSAFDKQQANLNARATSSAKTVLDASDGTDRSILEDYRAALQNIANDENLTDTERSKAAEAVEEVNERIKTKKGTFDTTGPVASGIAGFSALVAAKKKEALKEATDHAATRAARTAGGTIKDAADIENELMKDGVYKARADRQDVILGKPDAKTGKRSGGTLAAAKAIRGKFGSQMGSGGELKLRKLVSEAASGITSEDTTELCDGFIDALHKGKGFGPEALAYFDRIAATNNVNDLLSDPHILHELQKIDPSVKNGYSMEGMKALEKLMINEFGLPEQAVMSSLHRGFQHMKRSGNTFMSEMTEVKNGQYTWRAPQEWKNVALIESRKRSVKQQLASATRLQMGDGTDFYEGQRWTVENYGTLIPQGLNTDKSVTINADVFRHIESDSTRYVVMRNALLRSVKDAKLRKESLKALNEAVRKANISLSAVADEDRILDENVKVY